MTLIIYPDVDLWNFVMADLYPRADVRLFPLRRHTGYIQRVIRKFSPIANVPASLVFGVKLRKAIRSLDSGDSIVLCEYTEPTLISAIDHLLNPCVNRYCWLWNHHGEDPVFVRDYSHMQHHGFQCITYDEPDAHHYHLQWYHQFFCVHRYRHGGLHLQPVVRDFFFVGYIKDRESEIQAMQLLLSAYSSSFTIVHNLQEYIPYSQYMEQASQSRCIVDVMQSGDTSCTLRPLEALALRKKLITNNSCIRNYSFYHPQNIFIFGVDDIIKLPEFIQTPFVDLSPDVVDEYDVSRWLENFSEPL